MLKSHKTSKVDSRIVSSSMMLPGKLCSSNSSYSFGSENINTASTPGKKFISNSTDGQRRNTITCARISLDAKFKTYQGSD